MSATQHNQGGFTAVELLVTLFVAAAFLMAAYQLFTFVVRDGGETRAEAKATSVAYDYLRRYTPSVSNPCGGSTPLNNTPVTVDTLTQVTVSVTITCANASTNTVSKVQATVRYNNPQKTVVQATYVNK